MLDSVGKLMDSLNIFDDRKSLRYDYDYLIDGVKINRGCRIRVLVNLDRNVNKVDFVMDIEKDRFNINVTGVCYGTYCSITVTRVGDVRRLSIPEFISKDDVSLPVFLMYIKGVIDEMEKLKDDFDSRIRVLLEGLSSMLVTGGGRVEG